MTTKTPKATKKSAPTKTIALPGPRKPRKVRGPKKHAQGEIFGSGEDLPIFTAGLVFVQELVFAPSTTDGKQQTLLDLRPQFGADEPSYQITEAAQ